MKIKEFKKASKISNKLINSVIRCLGSKKQFKELAPKLDNLGAKDLAAYKCNTQDFVESYYSRIIKLLSSQTTAQGKDTLAHYLAGLENINLSVSEVQAGLLDVNSNSDKKQHLCNFLAWHTAELVAADYLRLNKARKMKQSA